MTAFLRVLVLSSVLFSQLAFGDQNGIGDYHEARDIFWRDLYKSGGQTIYCDLSVKTRQPFNIEHVFAASWMKRVSGCAKIGRKGCRKESARFNRMEGDLHNLHPSLTKVNSARGSLPFGIISNRISKPCDFEVNGGVVEPAPAARGDIARTLFYMEQEYGADIDRDSNSPGLKKLLKKWHCEDPVSQAEAQRNLRIKELQGNSNRFIEDSNAIECR